ncbi:GNAT family N-acetyltransferase [Paenibacillus sp. TRM 82003]|uniref:GNAT family N-acetyltransferase n=1 Tax=Kineococcus sp. TRM81007 TaxID=2925831 RepID=UPI001F568219|nr:GNAT family N-acetyltransferase [Kineococcus sp. TRM81007]MCI2239515.1 GNAT family N-acetyltransferase [Kineococcus sp. TRM81007]MCI3926204.1 GNAT family N-acetyltransferase [Paenibacillus sp. TRM 82003]
MRETAVVEVVPAERGDTRLEALLGEAVAELLRRYPDGSAEEYHLAPGTRFLLGLLDGEAAGCIAQSDADPVEFTGGVDMKRVFVREGARGHGVARRMVAAFEDLARERGARRVRLETGTKQPEAVALYTALGYERIEPFGQWADSPLCLCFGKEL